MPTIPLAGRPGVFDSRNPTLVPNFDRPVASGAGTTDSTSPAAFLAANPRVDATVTATIGGTPAAGDTVTLTVTCGQNVITHTYTVVSGDTVTTIAEGLGSLFNTDASANGLGLYTVMGGTSLSAELVFHWNGPVGNFAVLTDSLSAGATETVTLGNSGVFAGGSGPVIVTNNFNFSWNGATQSYWYGNPYILDYLLIKALVTQGLFIV